MHKYNFFNTQKIQQFPCYISSYSLHDHLYCTIITKIPTAGFSYQPTHICICTFSWTELLFPQADKCFHGLFILSFFDVRICVQLISVSGINHSLAAIFFLVQTFCFLKVRALSKALYFFFQAILHLFFHYCNLIFIMACLSYCFCSLNNKQGLFIQP